MSDADKQSKTFDPTPHRLEQARQQGQVAKSREVPTAAIVLAAGVALWMTGGNIIQAMVRSGRGAFRQAGAAGADLAVVTEVVARSLVDVAIAASPLIAMVLAAALFSHLGQTGILIVPSALAPKLDRLNPFKQLKNILGPVPAGMRTAVALLKMSFVGAVVAIVLSGEMDGVRRSVALPIDQTLATMAAAGIRVLIAAGLALAVVALIDFVYQRVRHKNQLKMTRDEVKREMREQEGSPEIKGRRKQMHRELSMNRIIEEVPHADVIVTNPTHYAVALRYEPGKDAAPRVVAKGIDAMALTIRRIARTAGVPIVENRALARGLHAKVKVGRHVPPDFFQAVAQVLAHVYRIKQRARGNA